MAASLLAGQAANRTVKAGNLNKISALHAFIGTRASP
jgi:hypothetical protein